MKTDNVRFTPVRLGFWNTFTGWVLRTRWLRRLAENQVCELSFMGRRSGRKVTLPVMYAQRGNTIVVLVGGPERKRWWRNFVQPHTVQVLLRGASQTGTARVVDHHSPDRAEAVSIYASRFPDLPPQEDPMVLISLRPASH